MSDHLSHPDPAVRELIADAYRTGWRMAVIAAENAARTADKAAAEVHS